MSDTGSGNLRRRNVPAAIDAVALDSVAESPRPAGSTTPTSSQQPPAQQSTLSWFLGQMRWLLYQYAVLASVMGVGIRWVWMLVRTVTFGTVMANGFLMMIWWYLTSPFTVRRVRYSDRLVQRTPLTLAHVRKSNTKKPKRAAVQGDQLPQLEAGTGSPVPKLPVALDQGAPVRHDRTPSTSSASSSDGSTILPGAGVSAASLTAADQLSPQRRRRGSQEPSAPHTPSLPRTARQPVGFDDSIHHHSMINASIAGGATAAAAFTTNTNANNETSAEAMDVADDEAAEDLDFNNRAYLDIHLPVPVDTLLAGGSGGSARRGLTLEEVLPPQKVQAKTAASKRSASPLSPPPSSGASTTAPPNVQHKRRGSTAGGADKLRTAQLYRERKSQQHPASLVGLRHAPEVYVPPTVSEDGTGVKFPVLVCVTGGAWIIGVHYWMAMMARVLSACGFIVVTPDYRNFPAALIPDMVDDVDDAIAWTIENISRFHGDTDRIYVLGQSAGAHLVTMSLLRQVAAIDLREHQQQQGSSSNGLGGGGGGANASMSSFATTDDIANPAYHPRNDIRAFIGLSGMYDLSGMADYLHSRGLYRGVLKRLCAGDIVGCSALAQLAEADARALSKYMPRTLLFIHGNSDTSAPPSESSHMAAVLRGKLAEVTAAAAMQYGAAFAKSMPLPNVKLHVLSGATHTTPIVEDLLSGRSETCALIVALAKQDLTTMQEEAAAQRNGGRRSGSRAVSPRLEQPRDAATEAADMAALDASFGGVAGSMTLTAETAAALQLMLGSQAPNRAAAAESTSHRAPVLKFRPLLWRWQASLASFVSAF